ncbi:TauD/TfdA family dioxygenase [Pseudomonas sp. SDO528_S397]|nr:TauD/TfdA family dioxygenase [Pseudomonas alliivorans]MEE4649325.1 TauD/TfdA family dioxygenase [Pseudomonas alliivorans]
MFELIEDARSNLSSSGWASFQLPLAGIEGMEQAALAIAYSLGQPRATRRRGPLIDHLVPTNRYAANPRSLSTRYGLCQFPWHTDGAHWSTPPRYLIMGCLEADQQTAETLICEGRYFAPLNSTVARSSVFRVTSGGNSFYAAARGTDDRYYRYDPGCMTPMDVGAREIMRAIEHKEPEGEHTIEWCAGTFLLLDNWRFLHRRAATIESAERKLLRVTVMENINNA